MTPSSILVPLASRRWQSVFPVALVFSALSIAGCATAPESLQPLPDPVASFAEAITAQQAGRDSDIVWGGQVVAVENRADTTRLTVAKRPLNAGFAPIADARTEGRFLADLSGFVDPTDFPTDTRVTLRGRVVALETLQIGDTERTAPVVQVDGFQRFRESAPVIVRDPFLSHRHRFYRDPFWPRARDRRDRRAWPPH